MSVLLPAVEAKEMQRHAAMVAELRSMRFHAACAIMPHLLCGVSEGTDWQAEDERSEKIAERAVAAAKVATAAADALMSVQGFPIVILQKAVAE